MFIMRYWTRFFCDKGTERDLARFEYLDHANMNIFFDETMPMFIFMILLHEYLGNNIFLLDTNAHDIWANK
jgi:hypothetical protein